MDLIYRDKNISEANTENLFREFYGSTTFIEKSAIPKIYGFKSKKGTNYRGYPDFFLDKPNFAIIVEAKALKHSLAEEEVKWYMKNNLITKPIIGIAISGQEKSQIKITYYYLDSNNNIMPFNVHDKFVPIHNLEKILDKHLSGESISTDELIIIIKRINEIFHRNHVKDTERSLLFSGMMIALTNNNFRSTYKSITKPSEEEIATTSQTIPESIYLSNFMLDAINKQLTSKINNLSKTINWIDQFSFIRNLEFNLEDYKLILNEIHNKIFIPFQNEEKQDILGKAYKIFLSKSGKIDNKNIIITPDHIKDLMIKLARLNLQDVVLDTCTGTGGFLMEAMEKLTNLAQDDENMLDEIKENKLIGFENDSTLFTLACSNMFLHGDGRSNMLFRNSLLNIDNNDSNKQKFVNNQDQKVYEYIKAKKPTKCIINPPYEGSNPINFVKQAIDYLEPNGKLIVIMPSTTLTKNQTSNEYYKHGLTGKILESAKLDFVIKMPLNIFSEQGRTVNTSIFGFTKVPHEKDDEVLFCKLKDDGLVSIQHKGRIDINNKWNDIENEILDIIRNNKIIDGISEKRKIWKNNELNCSGFYDIPNKDHMVKVKDLFTLTNGTLASTKETIDGKYNFITAADDWKKSDYADQHGPALVYAIKAAGSLGKCQYVEGEFVASNLCCVLKPKDPTNKPINLKFYNWYFSTIREQIFDDLADGASKLTINKTALENYYIEYIPIDKQNEFVNNYVYKYDCLNKKIKKLKNELIEEMNNII